MASIKLDFDRELMSAFKIFFRNSPSWKKKKSKILDHFSPVRMTIRFFPEQITKSLSLTGISSNKDSGT